MRPYCWIANARAATLIDYTKGVALATIVRSDEWFIAYFHLGFFKRAWFWKRLKSGTQAPFLWQFSPCRFFAKFGSMKDALIEVDATLEEIRAVSSKDGGAGRFYFVAEEESFSCW